MLTSANEPRGGDVFPSVLLPQQATVLSLTMPQVLSQPALIEMNDFGGGDNFPPTSEPQQVTVPSVRTAQL